MSNAKPKSCFFKGWDKFIVPITVLAYRFGEAYMFASIEKGAIA